MKMEPRKQKSQTLPPGVSPGKVSPNSGVGLFRRLRRRFRFKSKGYEFGIPEDESVQGVSFRRRSDEYSSKSDNDKRNEIPRSMSDRRAEKPMLTVINQGKKKRNKSDIPIMNGNGIFEFNKSMERSFEDPDLGVENNFIVTDDQVIDLDLPIEEKNEIFIEPDPGYETLDEVRRKMKLNQMAMNGVTCDQNNFMQDNIERENNLRVSLHRRTQSSGTAESYFRSNEVMGFEPNRDSGIGTPRIDVSPDSMQGCSSATNLGMSFSLHRPYTICGNSPDLSRIDCCPIKNQDSSSLQNCNEETTVSHQGFCNSDTCLCKYSANGDLYANPKILFRKRSQKKNDADFSISQAENCVEDSKDLDLVDSKTSPNEEGPPLPARKYSMYDDLKTPDSIKSPSDQVLNHENVLTLEQSTETCVLIGNVLQERIMKENESKMFPDNSDEQTFDSRKELAENDTFIRTVEDETHCSFSNNSKTNWKEQVSISESESNFSENADSSKCESENTSYISDTCGSLSVSISSSDTVKCIVLDSPLSTEGDSIPEELEILHISEDDEGYAELKDIEILKQKEIWANVQHKGENSASVFDRGENSANIIDKGENSSNVFEKGEISANVIDRGYSVNVLCKGEDTADVIDKGCNFASASYTAAYIHERGKGDKSEVHDREVKLGWISEGLENTNSYTGCHKNDKCITCSFVENFDNSAKSLNTETENCAKNFVDRFSEKVVNTGVSGNENLCTDSKPFYLERNSINENDCSSNVQNFDDLEGVTCTRQFISEAKQNVNLNLADNFAENCDDSGQRKNNILPTPEASQTQYFGDSRLDFRPLGNRHRKSSTLDSVCSYAESEDNLSIRSSEVLSDIHVMSYEDDADAILEGLASRRNSFADELDSDANGTSEVASAEVNLNCSNSQNQATLQKRLPDIYYDDSEPIHMSLAELGLREHQSQDDDSRISVETDDEDMSLNENIICNGPALPLRQKAVDIDNRPPAVVPRLHRDSTYRQDFMESMQQLKDCGWYWGPLSWAEAEIKLIDKADGSFLVRDSSDDRYILSLSFNMQGRVHHTRIEHHKGKFSFWSQPDTHGKSTIRQFIEQCVQNSRNGQFLYFVRPSGPGAPPIPVHLLHPVSRFKQMQSLQHTCRFKILQIVRRDHIDYLPLPTFVKNYLKEAQYYVEFLEE